MRFIKFAVLAALFALPISSANAGVVLNSLVQNEVVQLEDVDFETVLGGGGPNGTNLVEGSSLLAIAEFGAHNLAASGTSVFEGSQQTELITAISLVNVVGAPVISGGGAIADFQLVGATSAQWADIGIDAPDGTAFIAFLDPISDPDGHIVNGPTVEDGILSATEGERLFEFAVDNFFTATAIDTDATADPTNLLAIDILSTSGDFALTNNFTDIVLLEHNFLGAGNGFDNPSFLQLEGALEPSGPGAAGAFGIVTDTDVYLFAVPEPTSAISFVGLFGLAVLRRRRS